MANYGPYSRDEDGKFSSIQGVRGALKKEGFPMKGSDHKIYKGQFNSKAGLSVTKGAFGEVEVSFSPSRWASDADLTKGARTLSKAAKFLESKVPKSRIEIEKLDRTVMKIRISGR